jgi:hypothetical protein
MQNTQALELDTNRQIVDPDKILSFLRFQSSYKEGPKSHINEEELLAAYYSEDGQGLSKLRYDSIDLAVKYLTLGQESLSNLRFADEKIIQIYEYFSKISDVIQSEINAQTPMGDLLLDYYPFVEYLKFLSYGGNIHDYVAFFNIRGTSYTAEAAINSQVVNAIVKGDVKGFPNKIVRDKLFSNYIYTLDSNKEIDMNRILYFYIENILAGDPSGYIFVDEKGQYYDHSFKTQLKRFLELAVVYDYYQRKQCGDLALFKQPRIMIKDNIYTINAFEYYKSYAVRFKNPPALNFISDAILFDKRKEYIDYLKDKGVSYSSSSIETSISAGAIFLENIFINNGRSILNIPQLKRSRIKDSLKILNFLHYSLKDSI